MRTNQTAWTCDRCSTLVRKDINTQPYRWACVMINLQAVDPSVDHNAWDRKHICEKCRTELMEWFRLGRNQEDDE